MRSAVNSTVFTPSALGELALRNRFIRSGCFEGMCQQGRVTDALIAHHRRVAAGGVAMTTVAYCSVSHDGRAFDHELWMRPEVVPDLRRLTDEVHEEGAAASIQLGHCGFFTHRGVIGKKPLGASPKWCLFTRSRCREMTENDIEEKVDDFLAAARLARQAGFDAVEIHAGHGYLLSQFLSPWTNKRSDRYGGSLENRLRFPVRVISRLRDELGPGYPLLVKMNLQDGMPGGLTLDDAIRVAQAFEVAGASALVPSSGFTSKVPFLMLRGNLPVREMAANRKGWAERLGLKMFGRFMVPEHQWHPLFQREGARRIRAAVSIPVIYLGGVDSLENAQAVVDEGFPFVQIGRATIQDPDFVKRLASGEISRSQCDHCNRCVAAMDAGGVSCVSNQLGFQRG